MKIVRNVKHMKRSRRRLSIRKKIWGSAERPRLCVHKSNRNLYAQIIDDVQNRTLCGISTQADKISGKDNKTRKNVKFAEKIGGEIAKLAQEKNIKKVVFDRSGYRYHGVVKAVADAARKGGLEF
jgi:large subunit ribosomal protein L18